MTNLSIFRKNITSQNGEDGVIEKLFEIIGTTNKWCVEFGAGDGVQNSNTWNLINKKDWHAVLIEGDRSECSRLHARYQGSERVHTTRSFVTREGETRLDALLKQTPVPEKFGLLSIDIDGDDYYVWEAFEKYTPRVVIVEFNHTIPADIAFVQEYNARAPGGCSLKAITALGKKKGYTLVYAHGVNAFFVKSEELAGKELAAAAPEDFLSNLKTPRVFQLYDGSLVLEENTGYVRRLRKKKITDALVWFYRDGRLAPAHFTRDTRTLRSFKDLLKKTPLYTPLRKLIFSPPEKITPPL